MASWSWADSRSPHTLGQDEPCRRELGERVAARAPCRAEREGGRQREHTGAGPERRGERAGRAARRGGRGARGAGGAGRGGGGAAGRPPRAAGPDRGEWGRGGGM